MIRFTGSPSIGNLLGTATPQIVEAGVSVFDLLAGLVSTPGQGRSVAFGAIGDGSGHGANNPNTPRRSRGSRFSARPRLLISRAMETLTSC